MKEKEMEKGVESAIIPTRADARNPSRQESDMNWEPFFLTM